MEKKKKIIIGASIASGIGLLVAGIALKNHNTTAKATTLISQSISDSEKIFKGVPLSKLNEMAKNTRRGIKCGIDSSGYLVYTCKSNRGHQLLHCQMKTDSVGNLVQIGNEAYGTLWSSPREFIKSANNTFRFLKE